MNAAESEPLPSDVAIARSVRAHTRALLAMSGVAVVLALVGAGALSMAGPHGRDITMLAGLSLLTVGELMAVVGAVIAGVGLAALLRDVGPPGSTPSAQAATAHLPRTTLEHTSRRMALLMRAVVAAAVLGVTIWAFVDVDALIGAVVGALVALQVAIVVAIVRMRILRTALRTTR